MKGNGFFLRVHPLQALAEASAVAFVLLFLLSRQVGYVSAFVLTNGLLFVCAASGIWVVLRARLPQGDWPRQAAGELALGLLLSLVLAVGVRLATPLLGWEDLWRESTLGNLSTVTFVILLTGPGAVVARVGVRFWLLWNQMRRRRMLWALTHAQLVVVVLVAGLAALGAFGLYFLTDLETLFHGGGGTLPAFLAEWLLHTLFPGMMALIFLTILALVVLLPPSTLFSFLVARRTTRRLEALVAAAKALRTGDYDARVAVVGEDEVAQLQADFNAMADELEQTLHDLQVERDTVSRLLDARRELVAGVSHELRTPVAIVRATLESALDRWPERPAAVLRHDLEVMDGEVARLQGLLDDLFTLAQTDAGGLALAPRPMDVRPVIERMVEALAPLAWNSGRVEVVADLPGDLAPALADEARLAQILSNLLRNAIRHTPPGGIVAVMAAAEEQAVRIEVRDTGEGIAGEDLPHIWERFYRGGSSEQREVGGAGLGLALVKELTEAMGGSVAVESIIGQGSCFAVRLPRA